MHNCLSDKTNIKKFKENIYKIDNEIIQLSQEICPKTCYDNKSCGTCYILQDNNINNV